MEYFVPTGRARVVAIVGHPIGQVRSPSVVNAELAQRRADAVMIPVELPPHALATFMTVLRAWSNAEGAVITVPYKSSAAGLVDSLTDRARLLGAVNMVRRTSDGRLHGDMVDGLGFMAALARHAIVVHGARVAVFGGGAVGRALLLALAEAGAAAIMIHEPDPARADDFRNFAAAAGLAHLATMDAAVRYPEASIVVNSSPCGMRQDDPLPFDPERLHLRAHVADVVTEPAETPVLTRARALGHTIQTGREMAEAQRDIQLRTFNLLEPVS
jgi:shikimate dehydrogenase